ncbi:MAG: PAS domain-containing protein, partial [Chitinophagaceae bacterium]
MDRRLENENKVFQMAPVAMLLVKGPSLTVALANDRFLDHWETNAEYLTGKPLMEVIPEFAGNDFDTRLRKVMTTGETISVYGLPLVITRQGKKVNVFINFNCAPYREENGALSGVIIVLRDVTLEITSREQLIASEARFRALIEEAPVATCLFTGPEMKVEFINAMMISSWGKDFTVKHKPLIEALPELKGQPFMEILGEVYTSGKTYSAKAMRVNLVVEGVLGSYYYDYTLKPLLNEKSEVYGIINIAINVTREVLGRKKLEESETKLRGIISAAPAGIGLFVG